MGSVLRNTIIFLFLLIAVFWTYTALESCNQPEREVVTMKEASGTETATEADSAAADLEDLYVVEESDVAAGDVDGGGTPNPAEASDDLELGDANAPDEDVRAETGREDGRSGSTFGRYLVVTGSYLSEANAKLMSGQLQRKGYDAAEVFVFDCPNTTR